MFNTDDVFPTCTVVAEVPPTVNVPGVDVSIEGVEMPLGKDEVDGPVGPVAPAAPAEPAAPVGPV